MWTLQDKADEAKGFLQDKAQEAKDMAYDAKDTVVSKARGAKEEAKKQTGAPMLCLLTLISYCAHASTVTHQLVAVDASAAIFPHSPFKRITLIHLGAITCSGM